MPAHESDEALGRLYRDFLNQRVNAAEAKKEKKAFLRAHFAPEPLSIFRPVFFLPATLIAILLAVFLAPRFFDCQPAPLKPAVKVLRASSHEGPVMVYQKNYHDVPVTIVWVFTREVLHE